MLKTTGNAALSLCFSSSSPAAGWVEKADAQASSQQRLLLAYHIAARKVCLDVAEDWAEVHKSQVVLQVKTT